MVEYFDDGGSLKTAIVSGMVDRSVIEKLNSDESLEIVRLKACTLFKDRDYKLIQNPRIARVTIESCDFSALDVFDHFVLDRLTYLIVADSPNALRDLPPFNSSIRNFYFRDQAFRQDTELWINGLANLSQLAIDRTDIRDDGFRRAIMGLEGNLDYLSLSSPKIEFSDPEVGIFQNARTLDLRNSGVSDHAIPLLRRSFPQLVRLYVSNSNITLDGARQLYKWPELLVLETDHPTYSFNHHKQTFLNETKRGRALVSISGSAARSAVGDGCSRGVCRAELGPVRNIRATHLTKWLIELNRLSFAS